MAQEDDLFEGITMLEPTQIKEQMLDTSGEGGQQLTQEPGKVETLVLDNIEIEDFSEEGHTETTSTETSTGTDSSLKDTGLALKYSLFAKELLEAGVIEVEDVTELDNIDTLDSLKKVVEANGVTKKAEKLFNSFKENLSPDKKLFLELTEEKGLPTNLAAQYSENLTYYKNLKEEDLKDEDTAKQVLLQSYKLKGFSDEKANKLIERSIAIEELENDAKEAIPEITSYIESQIEATSKQVEETNKAVREKEENNFKTLMSSIDSATEILPDIKLTPTMKEQLKKSFTEVVEVTPDGKKLNRVQQQRNRNPLEFEKALHHLVQIGIINFNEKGEFKPDLSKLTKVAKTKAVGELDKVLEQEAIKANKSTGGTITPSRIDDLLEKFDKGSRGR